MSQKAFDEKLANIEALRTAPEQSAVEQLRKLLKDRNNYAVGKAAAVVASRQWTALIPDLVAAFERFLKDPAKTDPQCWAKNAIAQALKDMGHSDAEVYLSGVRHVQLEAVYGGRVDTAATLRGTCAIALTACSLPSFDILTILTDLLTDAVPSVRSDAARAIGHLSAREGALPLRLKARAGDAEPEVIGQVLAALLSLSPERYLDFVASFLEAKNADIRIEAAAVLANAAETRALDNIKTFWTKQTDPEVKRTLVQLLGGSPNPASADFLLAVLRSTATETVIAEVVRSLGTSRWRQGCHDDVGEFVRSNNSPLTTRAFQETFGE